MFAVVVRESGESEMINGSGQHLETNVLPRTRQAPSFVSGIWMTDRAGGHAERSRFRERGRSSRSARAGPQRPEAGAYAIGQRLDPRTKADALGIHAGLQTGGIASILSPCRCPGHRYGLPDGRPARRYGIPSRRGSRAGPQLAVQVAAP